MWLANREITHYTACPIWRPHKEILLKSGENNVSATGDRSFFLSSISLTLITTRFFVPFSRTVTDNLICLFYLLFGKMKLQSLSTIPFSHLLIVNSLSLSKLNSESNGTVCHGLILIKKCYVGNGGLSCVIQMVVAFFRVAIGSRIQYLFSFQ